VNSRGRVALIGGNGQLGSDINRIWADSKLGRSGMELISLTHAEFEVTDKERVRSVLSGIQPSLVINTAAFHRVDDCEKQAEEAFAVNGVAVKYLAEVCGELGATLMHFSTDYVFSGRTKKPYLEEDSTNPVSAYGISKEAGEHFLRYSLPDNHILIRSSGLYGYAGASGKGGNFVETMVRLAREERPIRVVNDQRCTPTYTLDLATVLIDLIEAGGRGTFHITNSGDCTWFEFAREVFAILGLSPDFGPTTSGEFAAPARRPEYSVLANKRLTALGIAQPRPWQEALRDYLLVRGHLLGQ
jgi:dTDP-4-dehydrorhamnose reductase